MTSAIQSHEGLCDDIDRSCVFAQNWSQLCVRISTFREVAVSSTSPPASAALSPEYLAVLARRDELDERTCTAEEGEKATLVYLVFLEQELTKARARLAVFRSEARLKERQRLAAVRGVEVASSVDPEDVVPPEVCDVKQEAVELGGTDEWKRKKQHPIRRRQSAGRWHNLREAPRQIP